MTAKYKQWDRVSVSGQSGTVVTVEERRAGFADYFVEFDDSAMWVQENEIDDDLPNDKPCKHNRTGYCFDCVREQHNQEALDGKYDGNCEVCDIRLTPEDVQRGRCSYCKNMIPYSSTAATNKV